MKKLVLIILTVISGLGLKAQWIDSLVVSPAMPDANDTVRIYAYLTFPQGNCAGVAYGTVAGNSIYASTLHCMGAAMFICNDVDTLVFPPLTAGTYSVYFTLSSGYGIPNCTPGFQADDEDTLTFQVSTVLDIPTQPEASVRIFPNPVSDHLTIQFPGGTIEKVQLLNVLGEEVLTAQPNSGSAEIPVTGLADGVYFCRITDSLGSIYLQQVEVVH